MKAILFALFAMMASMATAETSLTPDQVRERYPFAGAGQCTDNESGEQGFCHMFAGKGYFYLVFVQDGKPVFMRYVKPPEPYVTVWRSRPLGTSL